MTDTQATKPEDTRFHDPHLAGLYRLMALRFWCRYVEFRMTAELYGGDLSEHGPSGRAYEADKAYERAVNDFLGETPRTAAHALALVEFAGILAADRLIGEVTQEWVNDKRDAYHQSKALADAANFLHERAVEETLQAERKRLVNEGARP